MSVDIRVSKQLSAILDRLEGRTPREPVRGNPDLYSVGVNTSSIQNVIAPRAGGVALLLDMKHPTCDEFSGLCTVHVHVTSGASHAPFELQPNGRLLAHVEWWTGRSGGKCDLDISAGGMFTVAGTQNVRINIEQVTADEDVVLHPGDDLIVNAQCAWGGSAVPARPVFMTGLRQAIVGGVPANVLAIPDHATEVSLVSDNPLATLDLALLNRNSGATRYTTQFRPGAGQTPKVPIVSGAFNYRVSSSADCNCLAVFSMAIVWLMLLLPIATLLASAVPT